MKFIERPAIAGAVVLCLGLLQSEAIAAAAEAAKTNESAKKSVPSGAAEMTGQLSLADELARYGDAKKDPLALIVAAQIKKQIPVVDAPDLKPAKTGSAPDTQKSTGVDYSVEALLTRARSLAGDNKDVLALADDVQQTSSRGATGGPKRGRDGVLAGSTDSYRITFRGDQRAAVLVSGDGDTDLDLFVYDENGNLICSDEDATDVMLCEWEPAWTGPFLIEIKNLGRVRNRYEIITN
jgi:hypothetical protein